MPKAHEVAIELRKLADALDTNPESEVVAPNVYFSCKYESDAKEKFLAIAKVMPRPFEKFYDEGDLTLVHRTDALNVQAYTDRSLMCRIVEPAREAVYECEPLLSAEEEASIIE